MSLISNFKFQCLALNMNRHNLLYPYSCLFSFVCLSIEYIKHLFDMLCVIVKESMFIVYSDYPVYLYNKDIVEIVKLSEPRIR